LKSNEGVRQIRNFYNKKPPNNEGSYTTSTHDWAVGEKSHPAIQISQLNNEAQKNSR